jgi:hypothetical protein
MAVHLINPSDNSFGTAVITPRWLLVLAAATPWSTGDPILVDESLEQLDAVCLLCIFAAGYAKWTRGASEVFAIMESDSSPCERTFMGVQREYTRPQLSKMRSAQRTWRNPCEPHGASPIIPA